MDRLTLGKMQNPIRGFLHGGAAVATVVGLVFLIIRAWGSAAALVGALVFGLALLVMYTVSSLYHSIPWGKTWKTRLQRVDHSMIYLVVAGTFTPVAIAVLDGVRALGHRGDRDCSEIPASECQDLALGVTPAFHGMDSARLGARDRR